MNITVKINGDGAAFEDAPEEEFAAILRVAANIVQNNFEHGTHSLRDNNGNTVGSVVIASDD